MGIATGSVNARFGSLVASHSGLRETVHERLDGQRIDQAVGGLVAHVGGQSGNPVIGLARDDRAASAVHVATVRETLLRHGAAVVDLGVAVTPAAKLSARRHGLDGLVMVTGSHLADELTGLKLTSGPEHFPLDPNRLPQPVRPSRGGGRELDGFAAAAEHADAVAKSVDASSIRAAKLRVDVRGGAGDSAMLVLEALGCLPARDGRADAIVELDGDGDRLRLGDEHGTLLDPEATLPLAVLATGTRSVVRSADTSRAVDLLLARSGTVHIVPPGELHLLQGLTRQRAGLAGEGNGGVVIPAVGLARDGLATAACLLELLCREERTLSQVAAALPALHRVRSSLPLQEEAEAERALQVVANAPGAVAERRMVRIERGGDWGLVRPSATEPVLKVTAESSEPERAASLHDELRTLVSGALGASG